MPNLSIELQAFLAVANLANPIPPYIVTYDFGNPTLQGTSSYFDPYFQATTGGVAVPLPATPVFCVFIQNVTSTAVILQIAVTPTGGAPQNYLLGQQGLWMYSDPSETSGDGISAITLTGLVSTASAMVFVGG